MKNIYKEKFKKPYQKLIDPYKVKINGYKIGDCLILENGTDLVEDKQKSYLVLKIYMEEKDEKQNRN